MTQTEFTALLDVKSLIREMLESQKQSEQYLREIRLLLEKLYARGSGV